MSKKIHSVHGLFGTTIHYDENGNKVGKSVQGFFGGENHYDADGNCVGSSAPGIFADQIHYDANGNKVGDRFIRSGKPLSRRRRKSR